MNVSKAADAAFMQSLKSEDPRRYKNLVDNIHADGGSCGNEKCDCGRRVTESFAVVPGKDSFRSPARIKADRLMHERTVEEYVAALMAFINEEEPEISMALPEPLAVHRRKRRSDAKYVSAADKQRSYRLRKS